jgi:hypothetical protein
MLSCCAWTAAGTVLLGEAPHPTQQGLWCCFPGKAYDLSYALAAVAWHVCCMCAAGWMQQLLQQLLPRGGIICSS